MNTLANFPSLVVGLAFDVDEGDTRSGFKPAEEHLGSTEYNPLYAEPRIEGFAALLRLTKSRLIIAGSDERRFKGRTIDINAVPSPMWQGYLIRKMLIEDYGADETRIEWLAATGATGEAAHAARQYFQTRGIIVQEGTVEFCTSFYHCARTGRVALRRAGLPRLLTPAEAFTFAEAILQGREKEAEARLRSFGGHLNNSRIINEIHGIADDLLDNYQPQRKGW